MEENIVKKVCKELGITQAELGKELGVPTSTVQTWAQSTPKMITKMLELFLENKRYRDLLRQMKQTQNTLNTLDL